MFLILIYKKRSDFLLAAPNSLNDTAEVSSTSELISYGKAERENQFKESKISSEEKVEVQERPKL